MPGQAQRARRARVHLPCAATASPARSRPPTAARRGAAYPAGCSGGPRASRAPAARARRRTTRSPTTIASAGTSSRSNGHRARRRARPGRRDRSPRRSRRSGPGSRQLRCAARATAAHREHHAHQRRCLALPRERRLGRRRRAPARRRRRTCPHRGRGAVARTYPGPSSAATGLRAVRRRARHDQRERTRTIGDRDALHDDRRGRRGRRHLDVEVAAADEAEQREVDRSRARRRSPTRRSARTLGAAPIAPGRADGRGWHGPGAPRVAGTSDSAPDAAVPRPRRSPTHRPARRRRHRDASARRAENDRQRSTLMPPSAKSIRQQPEQPERDRAPLRRAPSAAAHRALP